MPRDIDDVVGPGHDMDVAILVDEPGIGGLVITGIGRQVGFDKALVLLPQGRERAGRQGQFDRDGADLARLYFDRLADGVGVQHAHIPARHRLCAGAVLDRQLLDAEAVGADRPARLGLPPMIDDRHLQLFLGPLHGRGIGPLAREEQCAKPGEIVFPDQFSVGVLLADRAECCRRGEQHADIMFGDHAPEGARIRGPDRLPLIHDRGAAIEERRVDRVGMPDRPAYV